MSTALTTLQKLNIGAVSEAFSVIDIAKQGLYGGGMTLDLPRKIYCIRESIQWRYDLDNSDDTLVGTSNYLLALCGRYYLQANAAIIGGGGTVVVPCQPSTDNSSFLNIDSNDFADATHYNNPQIVGKQLLVFANDFGNRFLEEGTEWAYTNTGIVILLPGFDATSNMYHIKLIIGGIISIPSGSITNTIRVVINGQYGTYLMADKTFVQALTYLTSQDQTVIVGTTLHGTDIWDNSLPIFNNQDFDDTILRTIQAGTTLYFEMLTGTNLNATWYATLHIN